MEFSLLKSQVFYYINQVLSLLGIKALVALLFAALVPHQITIQVLVALFTVDFITGVWVAKQMRRLSSAGMRRGLAKILIYFVFVAVVAMAEQSVIGSAHATKAAIGLLVATELVSIVENLIWLGLPVPYAAKVLSVVSSKAKNFGFRTAVDDSDVALTYTRDMVEILNNNVPRIRDTTLRECLKVYCASWYTFIRDLEPKQFEGSKELVWARLSATLDRVLVEMQTTMARGRVPRLHRDAFLNNWNKALLGRLFQQLQGVCMTDLSADDKVTQTRDYLMLMIYRLVNEAESLDRQVDNPLVAKKDHVIARDDTIPPVAIEVPLDPAS